MILLNLIKKHNIDFYEKKLGQLFCITSAKEIIDMLITECMAQNVEISKETKISSLTKSQNTYSIKTNKGCLLMLILSDCYRWVIYS